VPQDVLRQHGRWLVAPDETGSVVQVAPMLRDAQDIEIGELRAGP
jgi:hypothetical protein